MKYCDSNPNIIEWFSEEIHIPYISPVDDRMHRYFPDFWIMVRDKENQIKEYMIEVKPFKECKKPVRSPSDKTGRRFLNEARTYGVNQAKWKAARQFCEQSGIEFKILTEKELGTYAAKR